MAVALWTREEVRNDRTIGNEEFAKNPFDTMTWNGDRVPGIVSVTGVKRRLIRREKPQGKKRGEERQVLTGFQAAEISIVIRMWTLAQWTTYQNLVDRYFRNVNGQFSKAALTMAHPALAQLGLNKFTLQDVPLVSVSGQVGTVSIRVLEFTGDPKTVTVDQSNVLNLTVNTLPQFNAIQSGVTKNSLPGTDSRQKGPTAP